jgi:hypothetical protein
METVPLLRIEESADLFDGSVTAPYFVERPSHSSHHSAEKGGTNHVHPHLVPEAAHLKLA